MKLEEVFDKLNDEQKEQISKLENDEEIINFIKDSGFDVDVNCELSDDELENVTGGNVISDIFRSLIKNWFEKSGKEMISNIIGGGNNKTDNYINGNNDNNNNL